MKKIAIIAAVVLMVISCFSPWQGPDAMININLGGATQVSARTMVWNAIGWQDEDIISALLHNITLNGPTGTQTHTANGGVSIRLAVAPGLWEIEVETLFHGMLLGKGTGTIDVKAGQNNAVPITMEQSDTTLFTLGEYEWGFFSDWFGNSGEYCIILTETIEVETQPSTDYTFFSAAGVTVIGNGNTIKLDPLSSGNLLDIGAGQTVTIKNAYLAGFAGNNDPLIKVNNGGTFIMTGNGSVSSPNNEPLLEVSSGGTAIIGGNPYNPGTYYSIP